MVHPFGCQRNAVPLARANGTFVKMKKTNGAKDSGGRALALVPVLVALLLGSLMLPRSAPPEAVPMPKIDMRALARVRTADEVLSRQAREVHLSGDLRMFGSAIRD